MPTDHLDCGACGSDDTQLQPAEYDDEATVLHCYACGHDERI